jgi:hypothetical protein
VKISSEIMALGIKNVDIITLNFVLSGTVLDSHQNLEAFSISS